MIKIIFSGAPLSGKGTQCEYIRNEFNCVHLSTGDMLRAAVQAGSELGKMAKMYMNRGELLPDDVMIGIICERLLEDDCATRGWILDGFPRTTEQAEGLAKAGIECSVFITLDVPESLLIERGNGRRIDPVTGKIYHLKYSPPESQEVAARLQTRADDSEERVKVRIDGYRENLESVIGHYKRQQISIRGDRDSAVIWDDIRYKLYRKFKYNVIFSLGGPSSECSLITERLASAYEYSYISINKLLVEEPAEGLNTSSIDNSIEYGSRVPSRTMSALLEAAMSRSSNSRFLIEGFPFNVENLLCFYETLGERCFVGHLSCFTIAKLLCPIKILTFCLLPHQMLSSISILHRSIPL